MWNQIIYNLENLSFGKAMMQGLVNDLSILLPECHVSIWQLNDRTLNHICNNISTDDRHEPYSLNDNLKLLACVEKIYPIIDENVNKLTSWPLDNFYNIKKLAIFPWVNDGKVIALLLITSNDSQPFKDNLEEIPTLLLNLSDAGQKSLVNIMNDNDHLVLQGIGCSPGMAIGTGFTIMPIVDFNDINIAKAENLAVELTALADAVNSVRQDMLSITNKLSNNSEIIQAYLQMMDRHGLMRDIVNCMKSQNIDAKSGLKIVMQKTLQQFAHITDPYLKSRAVDIKDIGLRILAYLQFKSKKSIAYPEKIILVAEEVTIFDIAEVPLTNLVGVISVKGSKYSHASIFAKTLEIPVITGAKELSLTLCDNKNIFIDGYCGKILLNPKNHQLADIEHRIESNKLLIKSMAKLRSEPAKTSDNYAVSLYANIGESDLQSALASSAEGVGLFRSEASFINLNYFPNKNNQKLCYQKLLSTVSPKPVIIRTLDIGGDKQLSYFKYNEDNPYLGLRGIRFSLSHPEIFQEQIRAMITASENINNLHIMLPMVTNLYEVKLANKYIKNAYESCLEEGINVQMPAIGIMIETPAATMQIKAFAKMVDFFSIGTNDLTQYMMAVDRNNSKVSNLFDSFHPVVLKTLQQVVDDAHNSHKHISICGEFAADPMAAVLLVAMGYDTLSMSAVNLDKVKWCLSKFSLANCQKLLTESLLCEDSASVIALLKQAFKDNNLGQLAGMQEFT